MISALVDPTNQKLTQDALMDLGSTTFMNYVDANALAQAPPHQQKQMLGERLYPLIQQQQPDLAGKITGMLLEMENSELLLLLDSQQAVLLGNGRITTITPLLPIPLLLDQTSLKGIQRGVAPPKLGIVRSNARCRACSHVLHRACLELSRGHAHALPSSLALLLVVVLAPLAHFPPCSHALRCPIANAVLPPLLEGSRAFELRNQRAQLSLKGRRSGSETGRCLVATRKSELRRLRASHVCVVQHISGLICPRLRIRERGSVLAHAYGGGRNHSVLGLL